MDDSLGRKKDCRLGRGEQSSSTTAPYKEEEIGPNDTIIRRISPEQQVVWDDNRGRDRIFKKAYSDSSGENGGMSVDIELLIVATSEDERIRYSVYLDSVHAVFRCLLVPFFSSVLGASRIVLDYIDIQNGHLKCLGVPNIYGPTPCISIHGSRTSLLRQTGTTHENA